MTQEEIIRSPLGREQLVALAREAGFEFIEQFPEDFQKLFERFATLVAAHEREACAKLAENWDFNVQGLVKAIRSRGEK